jgi:hypothetical protein
MQSVQENSKAYDLIRQAAIELGVERGGMDTPISIDPIPAGPGGAGSMPTAWLRKR